MLEIEILPLPQRAFDRPCHERHVVRMNPLQNKLHGGFHCPVVLEDAKVFLRPEELAGGNLPAEAADMTQPLRFGQICLARPEFPGQALLLSHIHCGADETVEDSPVENRKTHPAYVSKFAVLPQDATRNIAT